MIHDVSVAYAVQIKVGVVGKVHYSGLIGSGLIAYLQTPVLSDGVGQGSGQSAGESVQAIGQNATENQLVLLSLDNLPCGMVKTFGTAVQRVLATVLGDVVSDLPYPCCSACTGECHRSGLPDWRTHRSCQERKDLPQNRRS